MAAADSNPPTAPVDPPKGDSMPAWVTPELIGQTIKVWQPYYRFPLTPDDAVGILLSVSRLFGVLFRD
jgi:predicted hotdog family 3-hydroxylacyl-ACP dehydratase